MKRRGRGMIVGGEGVGARWGDRFDVVNPATEQVCSTVPLGPEEDVDLAVAAAVRSFEPWRKTPATARGALLSALAWGLEAAAGEFAAAETAQNGKTLADAEFDVTSTVACLDYLAGAANKIFGETIRGPADYFVYTRREPVGARAHRTLELPSSH